MSKYPHTNLQVLADPLLNKGTAFSHTEREKFGLLGLLPPHVETLDTQVNRAYEAYCNLDTGLGKHIFLRTLQDTNEILFYALLVRHLQEMMPIIYTPVVGEACQQFSEIYRHPRGLIIPYPERNRISELLDNAITPSVEAIVVTDGERILGLGDQGAGGMGIPIGKLSLYSAAGGVDPATTLPILLDAGTNNNDRLNDPLYIGWRHERVTGDDYFEFVDLFVHAVKKKWPHVLLQFEDFAQKHAEPLLNKYRDRLCTFNDDIQGTAAVAAGTLLAASKVTGVELRDSTIAFLGAGSAGAGIAEQLIRLMVRQGLEESAARERIFMVDRNGLLTDTMPGLLEFQKRLTQSSSKISGWEKKNEGSIELADVVKNAKPNVLIGVSGQHGLFNEEIIRNMANGVQHPVVLPLSNPTSKVEAEPQDIVSWTNGRALVATGSPFDPVKFNGKTHRIAQCNNSYIFPGMALGVLASQAKRVTDGMFMAAAEALANLSPAQSDRTASLLPDIADIRDVSKKIAFSVAIQAGKDEVTPPLSEDKIAEAIEAKFWSPEYQTA